MILTYKVKHGRDFSTELEKAHRIAEVALKTRTLSSKNVAQFGLKSIVSNQILREYSRNRKLKRIGKVNLIVPNQGISKIEGKSIWIPSLRLELKYRFPDTFRKINQIELDSAYAYISVSVEEPETIDPKGFIGVDLNTTGHIAVVGNPDSGKILKLGKEALHIHNKYKFIRRKSQKNGRFSMLKRVKDREQRKMKDLNHKVSKKIIETAKESQYGIKLEKLEGIRKNGKHRKNFNFALNSWSFRQLQQFMEYKAKMQGIPIAYVEPEYTSQECSRCGNIGTRKGKEFVCQSCGHFDHADVNASFNIARRHGIGQFNADRDALKGSTDTPGGATLRTIETPNQRMNPTEFIRGRMSEAKFGPKWTNLL